MALCCITDAVDTLNNCVHGSVITNSRVGTIEIIIDSSRQTNTTNVIFLCKLHCTSQRTITSNYNKSVNAISLNLLISLLLTLVCHELLTARCLKYGTARHDDTTYIFCCKVFYLTINQAVIATVYTLNVEAITNACASDSTNCCIHTRSVSTRGKYSNCLNS